MSNVVKIEAVFDLDSIKEQIESSKTIKGDEAYFTQLAQIDVVKKQLSVLEDELKSIESTAKGFINSKAKALYGDNWQVISGENFKISRSKTGDMYLVTGEPSAKFVKIKKSVDSKAVDEFVAKNSKLPKGIAVNEQRGESIRISIKNANR